MRQGMLSIVVVLAALQVNTPELRAAARTTRPVGPTETGATSACGGTAKAQEATARSRAVGSTDKIGGAAQFERSSEGKSDSRYGEVSVLFRRPPPENAKRIIVTGTIDGFTTELGTLDKWAKHYMACGYTEYKINLTNRLAVSSDGKSSRTWGELINSRQDDTHTISIRQAGGTSLKFAPRGSFLKVVRRDGSMGLRVHLDPDGTSTKVVVAPSGPANKYSSGVLLH